MKSFIVGLLISLSTLTGTPTYANQALDQSKAMMQKTGITEQVDEIVQYAQQEITRRKTAIPQKQYKQLKKLFEQSYNATALYATATQTFLSQFNKKTFSDWQRKLDSPLMIEMAQLEVTAQQNEAFPEIVKYAQTLQLQPKNKVQLVTKLDNATRVSELAIETQISVTRALLIAINPTLPDNKQLSSTQMDAIINPIRQQLMTEIKTISLATHLYTYRNVSDEKLQNYIDQYLSDSGKQIVSLRSQAILNALKSALSRIQKQAESALSI